MQEIILIAAVGRDGAIGRDGRLLWHIRPDMRRFRAITMGYPVIMGRRTFESLPAALPGRRNIVVTRDAAYTAPGAETAPSPAAAIAMCAGAPRVMIIGGGQIYADTLPLATSLEITRVDTDTPDADTRFPAIDPAVWHADPAPVHTDPALGLSYSFLTYRKK